jgi:hypothetical protein
MKAFIIPAAAAALIGLAAASPAIAADNKAMDSQSSTTTNTTTSTQAMTDTQCNNLWSSALGSGNTDLSMDQASPYISDFKQADVDGDSKLSATEWMNACSKGLVTADAPGSSSGSTGASSGSTGAATLPPNVVGGQTSDRTPGEPEGRTPGAGSTGAAGTGAAQTPEGTSDRTPERQ